MAILLNLVKYIYIYIIQILCVCVCVSVKYRRLNGWTDHDQIWHAYADRSENGSYLKKSDPTTTQGAFGGVYGVKKVTNLGKIPNHWTDRDQIRHTYADSSGNGHRLNKLTGSRPQGAFGRGLGGHKFKNVG